MTFKFKPYQHVSIVPLDGHKGRISRCIIDGGEQPLYSVHYLVSCEGKSLEFYEDELEAV